jgi:hypothetical protein
VLASVAVSLVVPFAGVPTDITPVIPAVASIIMPLSEYPRTKQR